MFVYFWCSGFCKRTIGEQNDCEKIMNVKNCSTVSTAESKQIISKLQVQSYLLHSGILLPECKGTKGILLPLLLRGKTLIALLKS